MRLRMRRISNELWEQKQLFTHALELSAPIITVCDDPLNAEKIFVREWILAKRKQNMDDELFTILRIYCDIEKDTKQNGKRYETKWYLLNS